jgi:uncharacterized membrane protein
MKYLKMVLVSTVVVLLILAFFWICASLGGVWMLVSSALLVPTVIFLFYTMLSGLKNNEPLFAGLIMLVVAVVGLFAVVIIGNWPWVVIPGKAMAPCDQGLITPYVRLVVELFNWYSIIGFLVGVGIAILILTNLLNKKK